jgi:hypothetical protein
MVNKYTKVQNLSNKEQLKTRKAKQGRGGEDYVHVGGIGRGGDKVCKLRLVLVLGLGIADDILAEERGS